MEVHLTSGLYINVYNKKNIGEYTQNNLKKKQRKLFQNNSMNILLENEFSQSFFYPNQFNMLSLNISVNKLVNLLEETKVLIGKPFENYINGKPFNTELLHVPLSIQAQQTIDNIWHCPYAELSLQRVYMETKAQEWLIHFLAALDQRKSQTVADKFSHADKQRILEARDRLIADLSNPPTLKTLAHAMGTNEKKLTAGFKLLFGKPVYAYLREYRLQQAMQLLQ